MNIFNFNPADILSFFLTLFRVSIILFLLPFFGGQGVPRTLKGAMVLVISLAVWPSLSFPGELMPGSVLGIVLMILGEVVLGFILGLIVNMFFTAVQFGGQIMGFSMGFSMVNVMDPMTGIQEGVTAHFLWMCTMLTFLSINGHIYLLFALSKSFELVPPGQLFITSTAAHQVLLFSTRIFVVGVQVAAPILVAIFITDLALALIGRSSPQMNILMVGFPVKITVGMYFLGMVFQLVSTQTEEFVKGMGPLLTNILMGLSHP